MPMLPLAAPLLLLASQAPDAAHRADLEAGRFLHVLAETSHRVAQDPTDAAAWAARSQALASLQRFPEARADADRALALRPRLADALLARGLARAGQAIRQRDLSALREALGALDDFRGATEADPSLVPAWTSLGLAYQMLPGLLGGSTRRALACADRLAQVAPARGELLRALILVEDRRWREAEPAFHRALALAPGDPEVAGQWLDALDSRAAKEALGEAGKNARLVAEASRLQPAVRGRARGVTAVSDAYLHAGKGELAWQVLVAPGAGADAPSLVRAQLGKVAAVSGLHRTEALAALDQVLREPLEGGSAGLPGVWWRKGQILRDLGRPDDARHAAQEALALDPRHRGARDLLGQLGTR